MTELRKYFNHVLESAIVYLPNNRVKSVLNLGAVPEDHDKSKERILYKDYFFDRDFFTLDKIRNSNSENHFIADLQNEEDLKKIGKKFDLILNMSVLEHTENPFLVCENIKKLLNPKGYIFIAVPFFYPVHRKKKQFDDYWRFTDTSFNLFFGDMEKIFVDFCPGIDKKTPQGFVGLFRSKNESL